ncbi:MAG: hypothetical protein ABR568_05245 [Pyrinomonadaceae bacterium]
MKVADRVWFTNKYDPRNHTKEHETDVFIVLLRVISWIVLSVSATD